LALNNKLGYSPIVFILPSVGLGLLAGLKALGERPSLVYRLFSWLSLPSRRTGSGIVTYPVPIPLLSLLGWLLVWGSSIEIVDLEKSWR